MDVYSMPKRPGCDALNFMRHVLRGIIAILVILSLIPAGVGQVISGKVTLSNTVIQSNSPATASTSFITSVTGGVSMNNFTGYIGAEFSMSATKSLTDIGRYCVAG